ncbi:MAG: glycosyltransferase family 4 protein [Alphaproteobacteria bacterium]|nr:glycosyltransferase family 4 protein [Alphaproteobacteria bacterium]
MSALRFTVATPETEPLGGTESAICYVSCALSALGHDVTLIAQLPEDKPVTVFNIRHEPLQRLLDAAFFTAQDFDAIVICNMPTPALALRAMAPRAKLIYWAHILPDQPAMQPLAQVAVRDSFSAVVYVSRWQQAQIERTFGPIGNPCVIGNGVAPVFENMFDSAAALRQAKQDRAAYTTTPFRGLSILLHAMQGLGRQTSLDIFSSMRVYQHADDKYQDLFDLGRQNPAIVLQGAVSQKELADHLRRAAYLFYPCIYAETFCITAIEAMAAGLAVVTTDLGALAEVTEGRARLMPITTQSGDALADQFRHLMRDAIDDYNRDPVAWSEARFEAVQAVNRDFRWHSRAVAWDSFLGHTIA